MKKICEFCGNEFESKKIDGRFCCKKCKDSSRRIRLGKVPQVEHEVICHHCGEPFITVRNDKKYCSRRCKDRHTSKETPWDEYVEHRKQEAKQRQQVKRIEKEFYIKAHTVERECVICGSLFYCLDKEPNKTCSSKCSKKYAYKHKDKRIPREQIVDRDIRLDTLILRDRGVCWICGGSVDRTDLKIAPSGYKYPGDNYPVIEHVIPICRGGLHSWGNVRLAHHKCNAEKGSDLVEFVPLELSFAYKMKKEGNPAKKTAQIDLDGNVIKIWESTQEIKRTLGLNNKRIQEVCRGKGKTAFGYRWAYV